MSSCRKLKGSKHWDYIWLNLQIPLFFFVFAFFFSLKKNTFQLEYIFLHKRMIHINICLGAVSLLSFALPSIAIYTYIRYFLLMARSLLLINSVVISYNSAYPKPWACKGISKYSDSRFSGWIKVVSPPPSAMGIVWVW